MKTIKCPKCGEQFSVEETFYNAIVKFFTNPINTYLKKKYLCVRMDK